MIGKQKLFRILLALVLVAVAIGTIQQPGKAYFGEKYEPADGRVYHGLGQYITTPYYTHEERWQFAANYEGVTGTDQSPLIYATYWSINPANLDKNKTLTQIFQGQKGYLPLVGISYIDENEVANVAALLNGSWDPYIVDIANQIKDFGQPTFVRPGFEFGQGSDGIHRNLTATEFIDSWKYIHNKFNSLGVTNVAWVWNAVNPHKFTFTSYYPGDAWVDWYGVNYFTRLQMDKALNFFRDAKNHSKPVMVAETNPIEGNGVDEPLVWDNWFAPGFAKFDTYPHMKAFVYVSDPWDRNGFYHWWPNSQIDSNATVAQNYRTEMSKARWIHLEDYLADPSLVTGGGTPPPTTQPPPTTDPPPTTEPPPTTPPPDYSTARFRAIHDTFAWNTYPDNNYGRKSTVQIDNTPIKIAYLMFDLTTLPSGNIVSSKLRLYIYNGSRGTMTIKLVENSTWTETTLTYNNRPASTTTLQTFVASTGGAWYEIDVSSFIGNYLGGKVSIAIQTTSGDNLVFYSDEDATRKPDLVINYNP